MKYYVVEFDDEFDCLVDSQIPYEYEGISLNLGIQFDSLPTIKLVSKKSKLPDCIPNHRRYMYLSSKILHILKEFGFNQFQAFDVEIVDKLNNKIDTTHKLVNFLTVVPCIDRKNSILQIDEDEEDEDLNISDIKLLKLDKTKLKDHLIFRLGGYETLLIFQEDIAQSIVNARCTGVQFMDSDGYKI